MKKKLLLLTLLLAITSLSVLKAQEKTEHTAEELAKMSQNPLANMMSFPTQDNITFGNGPNSDRTSNVINIQPVLPFFDGHLITRTIIPIITVPDYTKESGGITAIGDINSTLFYSPTSKGGLTWGVGPVFVIPLGTRVSSKKFSLGASALVLKMTKKMVYGFVLNNVWSVAGNSDRPDVNSFLLQYFVNYNFPHGWYLSSAPIVTANWKADKGQQWIVPFGGGGGKIVKLGKIPFNLQTQVFWNAIRPDLTGPVALRLQIQMLLPK